MTDVVVDQAPKPQLPYDPNDIPDAVKKRVAAVEALYSQSNGSNGSDGQQPSGAPEAPSNVPGRSSDTADVDAVPPDTDVCGTFTS